MSPTASPSIDLGQTLAASDPSEWYATPLLDGLAGQIIEITDERALSAPIFGIIRQILSNNNFFSSDLNLFLSHYGTVVIKSATMTFTLSHLAGLTGCIKLATLLAKKGGFANDPICNGASPCHLAALNGHLNFLRHAESFGGSLLQPSSSGLTPVNVFEIIHPTHAKYSPHSSVPIAIPFVTEDGTLSEIKTEDAGFIYTDHICMNAPTVEQDLLGNPPFKALASPAPKIGLHKGLALIKLNNLFPHCRTDLGFGVIATSDIMSGAILGRYSGILWHSERSSDHTLSAMENLYFLSKQREKITDVAIDALHFGNLTSRFADGFPNVRTTCDEHGLCSLKSIEPISAGSIILWNYSSSHPVKFGPYIHFGETKLNEFLEELPIHIGEINKIPLTHLLTELTKQEHKAFIEKLDYIFSTPQLLWELFLTSKVDIGNFNEEFLARLNRFAKIFEIEYAVEELTLLSDVLSRLQTPEKKSLLLAHIKLIGQFNFKIALRFLKSYETTLPPSVSKFTAQEFEDYLEVLPWL